MVKTTCIICDEEITNPKIGVLHCDKDVCKKQFDSNMKELEDIAKPKGL